MKMMKVAFIMFVLQKNDGIFFARYRGWKAKIFLANFSTVLAPPKNSTYEF